MKNIFQIGTSGWNYASWRFNFYPKDGPQKRWLEYYSQYFDTVELNATFYRFFKEEQFSNWYERVPKNFEYVIKVPQYISHRKQLIDAEDQVKAFCERIHLLKNKLGLILLQLAPRTPYHPERLEEKLLQFGQYTKKLVVEFRNEKWQTDEVLSLLKKYRAIYCNVDSPTMRLQNILTSKIGYIRLHGRRRMYDYNYTQFELEDIAQQARQMHKQGAKTVYVFFNNDVNANSVMNALALKKILGEK